MRTAVALALALGLALRSYHYLSDPPVWHDEAALIVNVLDKNYSEHFGPLYYSEAAPPLFMWLERAVADILGDGTLALRLMPWLASCLALVLVFCIGRKLLAPAALLTFILLMACSDRLLWHACEAKPYAVDVLIAVGLLAVTFWLREDYLACTLLLLACAAPLLIFLSFPTCFLLGGFGLAMLPTVWRRGRLTDWSAYGLFLTVTCVAFAALYFGPIRAQRDERILDCWSWNFPDWRQPWLVPGQLLVKLTEVFRYASEPIGNVLSVLAVLGGVVLWRRGQGRILAALTLPIALAAFAWLLGHYPLGPSRVMAFAVPGCLLLVAAGTPAFLAGFRPDRIRLRRAVLVVLLAIPLVQAGYRVLVPWKRNDSATPAEFVLRQRKSNEPVVGTMWEHRYYFRSLRDDYRNLAPGPNEPQTPPPFASCKADASMSGPQALWLIAHDDCGSPDEVVRRLASPGEWQATSIHNFPAMAVIHATRPIGASFAPSAKVNATNSTEASRCATTFWPVTTTAR